MTTLERERERELKNRERIRGIPRNTPNPMEYSNIKGGNLKRGINDRWQPSYGRNKRIAMATSAAILNWRSSGKGKEGKEKEEEEEEEEEGKKKVPMTGYENHPPSNHPATVAD